MAHKKTLETINIEREKVLMKGYANIADIKNLFHVVTKELMK